MHTLLFMTRVHCFEIKCYFSNYSNDKYCICLKSRAYRLSDEGIIENLP